MQADQYHLAVKKACPRAHTCVLTQEGFLCLIQEDDPLPEDERFEKDVTFHKKLLLTNPSDVRSLEIYSAPKNKETDKFEFEQWPRVTRFKIGRRPSIVKWSRTKLNLDKPLTGWQRSTGQDQCKIGTTSDLYSSAFSF